MKLRNFLLSFLSVIVAFCVGSLYTFADSVTFNTILRDNLPTFASFSEADLLWTRNPSEVIIIDDLKSDVSYTVSYSSLNRVTDDIDFSLDTVTYTIDYPDQATSSFAFNFKLRDVFDSYPLDQFDSLQVFFGINLFLSDNQAAFIDRYASTLGPVRRTVNQDPEINPGWDFYQLDLPLNLVYSYQPTTKSTFYVFNVSIVNMDDYFFTDDTIFHIEFQLNPALNVVDLDFGSYFSYIGSQQLGQYFPPQTSPDFGNIWPDNGSLPIIELPDQGSIDLIQPSDFFQTLSELNLVTVLLVPLGLIGIGFFTFKIFVWK